MIVPTQRAVTGAAKARDPHASSNFEVVLKAFAIKNAIHKRQRHYVWALIVTQSGQSSYVTKILTLRCDAVYLGRNLAVFLRNLLFSFSR